MAHLLLQLGRLLVQLHRREVGRQLTLLDLEESLHRPGRRPLDRPHLTSSLLDPPERPLDPTMGLLDTGPDPLDHLRGLQQQAVGRPVTCIIGITRRPT